MPGTVVKTVRYNKTMMKHICLIETMSGGLRTARGYLAEMNARCSDFGDVGAAAKSGDTFDLIILLGRHEYTDYVQDIAVLKKSTALRNIPRIVVVPVGMSVAGHSSENADGETEFFMPVEKLAFLSAVAERLGIPNRRIFQTVISISLPDSRLQYSGMSLDFSETGIGFQSTAEFHEGQKIRVSFVNAKTRVRLNLDGEVVRKGSTHSAALFFYGIRFFGMSEEDRQELNRFMAGASSSSRSGPLR